MPKNKLTHIALDHLAATPEILRALLAGVSEDQTAARPAPGRWSVAEILEHLSHIEGHCFRSRLDRMLAEDAPRFDDYDQNALAAAGVYSDDDAEESFAHWEEQRDDNLEFLAALDPIVLTRKATHATLGEFTVEQLLNAWAAHDLSHIRQIAELVRLLVYVPSMGVFAQE